MTQSSSTLELSIADIDCLDEAEIARVLEEAATIVDRFASQTADKALADILALESRDGDGAAAHEAVSVARGITQQAQVLEQELSRFLAMRPDSQG